MDMIDSHLGWTQKIAKVVWRGNPRLNPAIRDPLVDITVNKSWVDVKAVTKAEDDPNFLMLDQHCKYQYLLHAEGTSYSGRFKFLQQCKSVIVAHPIEWQEFATHLMQADGSHQNFIRVQRNWYDLPTRLAYYLDHSDEAEQIAQRSYKLFNQQYLTPAAVSCDLRRLFHDWAKVQAFQPDIFEQSENKSVSHKLRGTPFEALAVSFTQERPGEFEKFKPG